MASRRLVLLVGAIVVLFLVGAWSVLERPAGSAGRAEQFRRVNTVLVLLPVVAALSAFAAATPYARGDRERTVWLAVGAACFLWAGGRAVFAYQQLLLGHPAPFPSLADAFTVGSGLVLFAGLALELGIAREALQPGQVIGLAAFAGVVLLAGAGFFLAPILRAGVRDVREALALLFSLGGIALVPLAVLPAFAFRGGLVSYTWVLVSAALVCQGLWILWFSHAVFYGLWFEGHPSNVLQLAAFALLAIGALWQRAVMLQEA